MGCRSMNKVDSRPSIPRLPSIGRFQDAKILSIDGKMTSISKHCGAKAVTARCKSAMASNETDTQIVPMGASVMGLFRHSLSIFGGDYVICRIFLQSTRIVVITRTYRAPVWAGIRAHPLERLVLEPLPKLEGGFFWERRASALGASARVAEKRCSTKLPGGKTGARKPVRTTLFPPTRVRPRRRIARVRLHRGPDEAR